MTAAPTTVGVVVVTFNSAAWLERCIDDLGESSDAELVIVDNGSSDGSVEVARSHGARVVAAGRNLGYATACNRGALALSGDHAWVAFVNPDVRVTAGELARMAREAPAGAGAVTPLLVDEAGVPQRDVVRPVPTVAGVAARYAIGARFEVAARRAHRRLLRASGRYVPTDIGTGACLLVREEAFEAVGRWSEAYFLNGEDVELTERIGRLGYDVVVDSAVVARHDKGSSSAGTRRVALLFECARSDVLFFARNRPVWSTVVVALAALVGSVSRATISVSRAEPPRPWRATLVDSWKLAKELALIVRGAATGGLPEEGAAPMFV